MVNSNVGYVKETKRRMYERLRSYLDQERSSFISHWRDLSDYIMPRRARFLISDTNRGEKRSQKIIDSTATFAANTLSSGLMSGVTNPSRNWFRLGFSNQEVMEELEVKVWLYNVEMKIYDMLSRSNFYDSCPVIYEDISVYGTSAMMVEEDLESGIRTYPFPIGSYMLALDDRGKVAVFYREFRMTIRQLIKKFGKRLPSGEVDPTNFTQYVWNEYKLGNLDIWIDVVHVIMPNEDYDDGRMEAKFKKFSSCYFERGIGDSGMGYLHQGADDDIYLRESGYDWFPVLCPRWSVTGEDTYASSCPGMVALGDIKALQLLHKRKAQAIEKGVNPPMVAPSSLRHGKASILPGDVTYVDSSNGGQGFGPAHNVNLDIEQVIFDINNHIQRINQAFYVPLILSLITSDRRQMTAREVEERSNEKQFILGRLMQRIDQDFLGPLIDISFWTLQKQGVLPEPPDSIRGMPIKVEYISLMAQALKMGAVGSYDRFINMVSMVGKLNPEVFDKVNMDAYIDEYGDMVGVDPTIFQPPEVVAQIRGQRQQQFAAQQQAENAKTAALSAKMMAETDTSKPSALRDVTDSMEAAGVEE
jgi:hypothetical protein